MERMSHSKRFTESYMHSGNAATSQLVKVFPRAPCGALRPFVKRFLVVEFSTAQKDSHLPDTGLVGGFCFKGYCILHGETKMPQAALTGLWDCARNHEHSV
jgi:hypothetical protein